MSFASFHPALPRAHRVLCRVLTSAMILGALGLVTGCGGTVERGDKRTGQRCAEDNECRRGLCVSGVAGDNAVCTVSCARSRDCPEGWSCTGLTQNNVLVCSQGGPTPFGGPGSAGGRPRGPRPRPGAGQSSGASGQ